MFLVRTLVAVALAPLLALASACGGGASEVDPKEIAGKTPLNPRAADGRPIHLGFGHHPDCFVLAPGGDAESVACPDAALVSLRSCPGGLLYGGAAERCVCVPAGGDPPRRVDCAAP